jgi:hypothetical protein
VLGAVRIGYPTWKKKKGVNALTKPHAMEKARGFMDDALSFWQHGFLFLEGRVARS